MSTYTPDQLDIIDIDVHNYVMGFVYRRDDRGVLRWHDRECKPLAATHTVPQYTRDWNAMGEVLTVMLDELPSIIWRCGDEPPFGQLRWMCDFRRDSGPGKAWKGATADTMPIAVALAALRAKGIEVKL